MHRLEWRKARFNDIAVFQRGSDSWNNGRESEEGI